MYIHKLLEYTEAAAAATVVVVVEAAFRYY